MSIETKKTISLPVRNRNRKVRNGVIIAIAKVFDLGNTIKSLQIHSSSHLDLGNLRSDWEAVGNDIRTSIKVFENRKLKRLQT